MSRVYGPVPSRRLGQSLGVDPIPFKTCNYNCVYCQLGRTTPVINVRHEFYPLEDIVSEVRTALGDLAPGAVDYVTVVGQGEPLLYYGLGRLVRELKAATDIPLAIITNGSLMHVAPVRDEIQSADVVMPTLDAADEETFHAINRPWPELRVAAIIEGMAAFREVFDGQLWLEVMLVRGLNDTEPVLETLAEALTRIRPDEVHLNVPIRPPAEAWVQPPDNAGLVRAMSILGDVAVINLPAEGWFELSDGLSAAEAIVEIVRRHPMADAELMRTLSRVSPETLRDTLESLEQGGEVRKLVYRGQVFWEYSGSRFSRAS